LPAACIAISPWADLTCSSETIDIKAAWQPNIERGRLKRMAEAYLAGTDDRTPLASPIFGDLAGLPPLLIQVGSEEALLADSQALHDQAQAAGIESTLELWDDMVHVWHNYYHRLSEARDAIDRIGGFLAAAWQAKAA
jgi:acetyl esterase/lipase